MWEENTIFAPNFPQSVQPAQAKTEKNYILWN